MPNSAVIFEFADALNVPWSWRFVIHFNEASGKGWANKGAKLYVKGPGFITLYHGEALVQLGEAQPFLVKVDDKDYTNYPPWRMQL